MVLIYDNVNSKTKFLKKPRNEIPFIIYFLYSYGTSMLITSCHIAGSTTLDSSFLLVF